MIAGKYRLDAPLGEGGQGAVWQATNLALEAPVAIKIGHPSPDSEGQELRLIQEARAVARLGHPAIVRMFDISRTQSGDWFLVMELLEGEGLGQLLTRVGRLSAVDAVRLLLPIADAMSVLHANGIVHRDLKPDNVFVARSGDLLQPKLLDFGVVKLRTDNRSMQTEAGALVGTPGYLSPEQARCDRDIDLRADVWAFCTTFYECVTGAMAFEEDSPDALLRAICSDDPSPLSTYGINEPELQAILERGLKKAREERWPSMRALGEALALWLRERGVVEDSCGVSLDAKWLRAARAKLASEPTMSLPPPRANVPLPRSWAALTHSRKSLGNAVWRLSKAGTWSAMTPARRWGTALTGTSATVALVWALSVNFGTLDAAPIGKPHEPSAVATATSAPEAPSTPPIQAAAATPEPELPGAPGAATAPSVQPSEAAVPLELDDGADAGTVQATVRATLSLPKPFVKPATKSLPQRVEPAAAPSDLPKPADAGPRNPEKHEQADLLDPY